jgi:hypothetical protein
MWIGRGEVYPPTLRPATAGARNRRERSKRQGRKAIDAVQPATLERMMLIPNLNR